jgi:hypothetical protein
MEEDSYEAADDPDRHAVDSYPEGSPDRICSFECGAAASSPWTMATPLARLVSSTNRGSRP